MRNSRFLAAAGVLSVGAALGACGGMGNYTNPELSLTGARVIGDRATLGVRVENPSDFDLVLEEVQWSLVYGPLPVADGAWVVNESLPSKGAIEMTKVVRFENPPMDRGAGEMTLSGQMELTDPSSSGEMAFESAAFEATSEVESGG